MQSPRVCVCVCSTKKLLWIAKQEQVLLRVLTSERKKKTLFSSFTCSIVESRKEEEEGDEDVRVDEVRASLEKYFDEY